jgi:hypothetical protein
MKSVTEQLAQVAELPSTPGGKLRLAAGVLAAVTLATLLTIGALSVAQLVAGGREDSAAGRITSVLVEVQRRAGVGVEMTGTSIPPMTVGSGHEITQAAEPIEISVIEITTLTPADKFAFAITPLIVALAMGSVALVWIGLAQSVERSEV